MRKIFCVILILVLILVMCSALSFASAGTGADVNPDPEIHRVIGGLYSLAACVSLNDNQNPHINNLVSNFKDIPENWQNNAKVERVDSSIWVGVNVNKYSDARRFLRDNAESLGITESPEGPSWIGGTEAWLKAGDITNGKIRSLRLKASKGSGEDSDIIFLSTEGQSSWWQMNPTPKSAFADRIISQWGVKNVSGLHKPEASAKTNSIYESVKPSSVKKKPANIHIGTRKNSLDMSTSIGDVIFTPVPQLKRDRTTIEEIDDDNKQISSENVNYDKTGSEQDESANN